MIYLLLAALLTFAAGQTGTGTTYEVDCEIMTQTQCTESPVCTLNVENECEEVEEVEAAEEAAEANAEIAEENAEIAEENAEMAAEVVATVGTGSVAGSTSTSTSGTASSGTSSATSSSSSSSTTITTVIDSAGNVISTETSHTSSATVDSSTGSTASTVAQCQDGVFGLPFCTGWCNTKNHVDGTGKWGCGFATLKAIDQRNTGDTDYRCDCTGCNGCVRNGGTGASSGSSSATSGSSSGTSGSSSSATSVQISCELIVDGTQCRATAGCALDEDECILIELEESACEYQITQASCEGQTGCAWDGEECAESEGEIEAIIEREGEVFCEGLDSVTCGQTAGCFMDEGECAESEIERELEQELFCEGLTPEVCANTPGCILEEGECADPLVLLTTHKGDPQSSTNLVSMTTVGIISFVFGLGCANMFFRATQKTDDTYAIMLDESNLSSRVV